MMYKMIWMITFLTASTLYPMDRSNTFANKQQLRNFFSHYNFSYDASNFNMTDSSGMTALMRAMMHQRDYVYVDGRYQAVNLPEIVTDLIKHGADPNIALGQCRACNTLEIFVVSVIMCLCATIVGHMRESTFSNQTTTDAILLSIIASSATLAITSVINKGECMHNKKGYTALSFAIRSSHQATPKIEALCSSSPVTLNMRIKDYKHTLSYQEGGPSNFEYGFPELRYPLDEYRKKIRKNGKTDIRFAMEEFLGANCSGLVAQYYDDYPFAQEYPLPLEHKKDTDTDEDEETERERKKND